MRIDCTSLLNLGQEFFRWEIATATAGALLGINAFNQPNVQESKDFTKSSIEEYKKNGRLPEETPVFTDGDVRLFADDANRQTLDGAASLSHAVAAHLSRVRIGDYVAINAYLERTPAVHDAFQRIRAAIRDTKQISTTLGYGPRFLHSTGQLHKGGPDSGIFFQITSDQKEDLEIPDEPYSFGTLVAAQALGDLKSLSTRNRLVIRLHLGHDVEAGLRRIQKAVEEAMLGPTSDDQCPA